MAKIPHRCITSGGRDENIFIRHLKGLLCLNLIKLVLLTVGVRVNTVVRSKDQSEAFREKIGAASESGQGFKEVSDLKAAVPPYEQWSTGGGLLTLWSLHWLLGTVNLEAIDSTGSFYCALQSN
ncbi:hypothetical protein XENOCAPTIV_000104 [Xenoophorus captivus]|uniref:Uncharacterized protein n=1 Tax=Xenoophorus captivus TaxID=1517983 RepID=A0ABV0RY47_9TELE